MTWKSRRIRLALAALGVGTTSSWDAPTDVVSLLHMANGKQGFSKGSVIPFPAGIFPVVCIFSWTKLMDCMTFPFNTLSPWVWDFFFFSSFWSNRGWEMVLCLKKACQECMSWPWCHTNTEFSFVFSQVEYLVCYLSSNLVTMSLIKACPGILWSTSRSLLPCFKFLLSPPLF